MENISITVNNLNQAEVLQLCKVLQDNLSIDIILTNRDENKIPLQNRIIIMLTTLGMNSKLKGYQYMKSAIEECYLHNGELMSMTKQLYPNIAQKYKTTGSRVEHAMRTALEKSWGTGSIKLQKEIFGYHTMINDVKPSNSTFIAAVTDYLILHDNVVLTS